MRTLYLYRQNVYKCKNTQKLYVVHKENSLEVGFATGIKFKGWFYIITSNRKLKKIIIKHTGYCKIDYTI